jgi:hypothetical protein
MLRWLISILLLLNLALFVWGYVQPQPPEEHVAPLPDGLPTIRLLAERDRPQPASESRGRQEPGPDVADAHKDAVMSKAAAEPTAPEQRSLRCLRLGPFDRQEAASAAVDELSAAGHETRVEVEIDRSQSGYWVLIPPGNDDPDFVIVNLELAGIQDLWRFDKGELAGAISLGLFSDRKQAQARQIGLQEMGFDAEIRPRYLEKPGYWIESSYAQGDEAAEAALEQLYVEHSWLGYPPRKCEEVATP